MKSYSLGIVIAVLFLTPIVVSSQSYIEDYKVLFDRFTQDGNVDYASLQADPDEINMLYQDVLELDPSTLSVADRKAYWINAYNIVVIYKIIKHYPISSVKKISGFFTDKLSFHEGTYSLNEIEKKLIADKGAIIHMALVCGAASCPPLYPDPYVGSALDDQLDEVARQAMVDKAIVSLEDNQLWISEIFKWYISDFGDVMNFINLYADQNYSPDILTKYTPYDWSLNMVMTGSSTSSSTLLNDELRYYASNLYDRGEYEWYIFNNYYTQLDCASGLRSNFFTTLLQYTLGYSTRVNYALELRLRSVTIGPEAIIGQWEALRLSNSGPRRIGVSAITPKIKYQLIRTVPNLTVQHSLSIPLTFDGEGGQGRPFLDWNTPSIYNDIYYDTNLTDRLSLFLQVGMYIESIGAVVVPSRDGYFQYSSPITVIYSYFPTEKSTIYALMNAAPRWGYQFSNAGSEFTTFPDHYNQLGLGYKYFVTNGWQLEILYTKFFTNRQNVSAATFNLGARYYGWD